MNKFFSADIFKFVIINISGKPQTFLQLAIGLDELSHNAYIEYHCRQAWLKTIFYRFRLVFPGCDVENQCRQVSIHI